MKRTFHDLDIMGLNPGRVEFGVCSTSVEVYLNQNNICDVHNTRPVKYYN